MNNWDWRRDVEGSELPFAVVEDNVIQLANAAFCGVSGQAPGGELSALFGEKDCAQIQWFLQQSLLESEKIEATLSSGPNAAVAVMLQIWPLSMHRFLLSVRLKFSIERLADLDQLTLLPNRRKALLLLRQEENRANRARSFCLALGDIDHFKNVNDTHGHDIGDQALLHVSRVVSLHLRASDWCARWGGEEFMVFLDDTDLANGIEPLERVREAVEKASFAGPPRLNITISFGIACKDDHDSVHNLINAADEFLYHAKHSGRNRVSWDDGRQTIWTRRRIEKLIADNAVCPLLNKVVDGDGRRILSVARHGIQNGGDEDGKILLDAAARLHQSAAVDFALIKAIPAAAGDTVVPVAEATLQSSLSELSELVKRSPIIVGVSESVDKEILQQLGAPTALLDCHPDQIPVQSLCDGLFTHLFLPAGAAAEKLLSVAPTATKVYAPMPTAAADKKRLLDGGVAGFFRPA